uniref:Uncharacterized protein n=1 Tax=Heterosigma akashiwo TaxID=2829 RepID=A0A7S3YMI1_HETAK
MHVFRSGSDGRRTLIGTVSVGKEIPYIHQISVTENYAILVKYPVNWPLGGSSDFLRNLEWKGADEPTKIYVFDLKSENLAPIKTFESTPFFSYHHINAFERKEESQIVLDLIGYDTLDIVNSDDGFLYIDKMANPDTRDRTVGGGQVQKTYRLVLDLPGSLSAGATSTFARPFVVPQYFPRRDKTGYMHGTEFPTINSNFNGKPYRYVYGASAYAGLRAATGAPEFANWALIKQDLAAAEGDPDGTTALVWSAPSQYPSEPVFVADPDGSAEDDGVLLSQVYDGHRDEAYLLCLDAQTMLPVAKAYTGRRAGMDFHGKWFDDYDGSL